MSLARWNSLTKLYPFVKSLQPHISVMYSLDFYKPRYKLHSPRDFMAWAETQLNCTTEDLQRLEILVFQDLTRG